MMYSITRSPAINSYVNEPDINRSLSCSRYVAIVTVAPEILSLYV